MNKLTLHQKYVIAGYTHRSNPSYNAVRFNNFKHAGFISGIAEELFLKNMETFYKPQTLTLENIMNFDVARAILDVCSLDQSL